MSASSDLDISSVEKQACGDAESHGALIEAKKGSINAGIGTTKPGWTVCVLVAAVVSCFF